MPYKIQDTFEASDGITTSIYTGSPTSITIDSGQTSTILTLTKDRYSSLVLDVYLKGVQIDPNAPDDPSTYYALQTVYILFSHDLNDSEISITSRTDVSSPNAMGTEPNYDVKFNSDTIVYTSEFDIENNLCLIKLQNNTTIGPITYKGVVTSFIL